MADRTVYSGPEAAAGTANVVADDDRTPATGEATSAPSSGPADPADPSGATDTADPSDTADPQDAGDPGVAMPGDVASGTATTVPPPSGPGDLSVVPVAPQETLAPVEVDDTASVEDKFSVEITLDQVDVTASRPGEIGGEALEVTVRMTNDGPTARDVSTVSVSVDDADDRPLSPLYGDPYSPIEGQLASKGSTEGTYVFTLADSTEPFTVSVSATAQDPVAVFVGSLEGGGGR